MIAYNTTWLANLRVQEKLKNDEEKRLISAAEYNAIVARYPVGFYTPNLFVRGGLAILTCIIVSFADGFLSLPLTSGVNIEMGIWFLFLGALTYLASELMVKSKFHYRSGVDDALLLIAALQIGGGILSLLFKNGPTNYLVTTAVIALLGAYFTMRFADALMAAVTSVSFLLFIFRLWLQIVPAGLASAPFAMTLASGALYWLSLKLSRMPSLVNYHLSIEVLSLVTLLGFYAAGNYYVIQNLSAEMAGKNLPVPFGGVFWVWTFAIPALYVYFGLRKKDTMLLRIGLLLIVAAGFTFRAYYHLMPVEIMLTIVGSAILLLVYGISRYLKTPKHGITADEPSEKRTIDGLKVESLATAASFAHAPEAPTNNGFKFGGGDFGGGGSSSGY